MFWEPCARNLPFLDGVCAEHFGSFESVNGSTGNYDTDGGVAQNHRGGNTNEKWQTGLDIVKRFDGGAKVCNFDGYFGFFRACDESTFIRHSTPVDTVKNPFLTGFSLCHMWNWSVASRDGARWMGHVKLF